MIGKTEIEVKGARQNNLQNFDLNIPRDKLTVITGVSGSGKSSLAFDILYGEGQRRFLDSLPAFSRNRISQLKKPDVDFVFGLSPVIAIEQKRGLVNPRSTVGTMTEIYDYLRLLFSTVGTVKCPYCDETFDIRSSGEIVEAVLSLPENTEVEFLTPVSKIYGENYQYLFDEIRQKGYHNLRIDGEKHDISEEIEIDEYDDHDIKVLIDNIKVSNKIEKSITNTLEKALELIGEHVIIVEILSEGVSEEVKDSFYEKIGCKEHHITMANIESPYFSFNNISSSCKTCGGIGTSKKAEPRLMVVNQNKSINDGAFDASVYNSKGEITYKHILMYNLSKKYNFSMDKPFKNLSDEIKDILFYGTKDEKITIEAPPNLKKRNWLVGRTIKFSGFVNQTEHWYREMLRKDKINEAIMKWFKEKMVEYTCPDCGGKKLKDQRFNILINDKNIHEIAWMQLSEVIEFLENLSFPQNKKHIVEPIVEEIRKRVALLVEVGLDYLSLGRRADTISGGEAQRIKLASELGKIKSGKNNLYILDEPTTGLHISDIKKLMNCLDLFIKKGHSILVIEHNLEVLKMADHIIDLGPEGGKHGGFIVAQGTPEEIISIKESVTGEYLKKVLI